MTWLRHYFFGNFKKALLRKQGNQYCHWSSSVPQIDGLRPNFILIWCLQKQLPHPGFPTFPVVEGNCFFSHSQKHVEERRQSQMEAWRYGRAMQKRLKSQTTSESTTSEEAKCQFLNFFLFCHITKKRKEISALLCYAMQNSWPFSRVSCSGISKRNSPCHIFLLCNLSIINSQTLKKWQKSQVLHTLGLLFSFYCGPIIS